MNIAGILRHWPKGTKLYSTIFGEVTLDKVDMHDIYPIVVCKFNHVKTSFDKEGHYLEDYPGAECVLFPSKEQRDWEKFRLPVKKGDIMMTEDKFKPFDKVLVRNNPFDLWYADIYLGYFEGRSFPYRCATSYYKTCIPYEGNEHLVGKTANH